MSAWRGPPEGCVKLVFGMNMKQCTQYNVKYVYIGWFLGLGMRPTDTFSSPASASSVVEVRDLHHEVGLDMGTIFMHHMSIWGGSWGPGCCRRARFRRRRRRRRS